jgi:bidirectional [NiFe] hydrogenase diaphorase subunit
MSAQGAVVALRIDGKDVSGRIDETILEVARENQIQIYTLCYLEGLSGWGACRLCLVEVKGTKKLLPACVTRVSEGMEVSTNTPRLQAHRRMIVELLLSERNHVCSVCVANGNCELQSLAARLGISHVTIGYRYPKLECDSSSDLFQLDQNRCVLCTRCVRVCDEIEGAHTWDVMGRGVESRVIVDLDQPWGDSLSCTACGKCVRVCPTGALTRKSTSFAEMQKGGGFLPALRATRGSANSGGGRS